MDSPQSVVSPLKNTLLAEPERTRCDLYAKSSSPLSKATEVTSKETMAYNFDDFIGVLEVFVHQARDIHNICIYHKQDVYAKLCLTSDPENSVSTKTINGGGRNPVFNDNVRLNVRTIECSLKCEIWMLSRVKNYLEDQLLGFALVPLSEVLLTKGKLEKEFSLSSTDLFHSPAGFVQLSLSYNGTCPEVMEIRSVPKSLTTDAIVQDSAVTESLPGDLDKIEFPDPKIENENESMVSEYFGMSSTTMDTQKSDSLVSSEAEEQLISTGANTAADSPRVPKPDSPPSSGSANGVASSPGLPSPAVASSQSSDSQSAPKSPTEEHVSAPKEKPVEVEEGESESSRGASSDAFTKPVVSVNIEPEQNVVQQEIVDMYMKSMQQFTESLAKMKLPLDIDSGPTNSENSSSDQKLQPSKNNGSRVFYGSRAFF